MRGLPGLAAVLAGATVVLAVAAPATVAAAGDRKLAEELKKQGDAAAAAGDPAKALVAYERAMAVDAAYLPAYDAAAPLWFAAKQYDVAVAHLEVAVKAEPKYAMGWYNLAFAQRKKGDNAAAVAGYQKFIDLRPGEPDAYYGMGLAYKAMGERDKARAALKKYIELEKRADKQTFVDKARAELAALDAAAAPAAAPAAPAAPAGTPVVVAPPPVTPAPAPTEKGQNQKKKDAKAAPEPPATPRTRAEASKLAGDARRDGGDAAAAERSYRAAIAADPSWPAPYNELGTLLIELGRTEDAVAHFEKAVLLDARFELAWYNLAHARRKLGRHEQAVAAYRKYIELAPGNPDPYYGLGQSLLALGDRAGARAAFARYVELEKRPSEQKWVDKAKQELARLDAGGDGKAPDAAAAPPATTSALARTPGVMTPMPAASAAQVSAARSWRDKGDAAFAAKKYDQAAADYRGAIAADPTGIDARYRLGVTLAASGDLAGAIGAWEGVLLLDPAHEKARRNIELARKKLRRPEGGAAAPDDSTALARARALVDDGRWASALALLDSLLADARHAQDASVLSLRAEARLGGGDAAGAVVDWLGVLALDPRFARAYRGLADAYGVLGDTARAAYFRDLGTSIAN